MSSILKVSCSITAMVFMTSMVYSQTQNIQAKNSDMKTIQDQQKETIRYLYDVILNERKLELLEDIVSANYTNHEGGSGIEGFKKGITGIVHAFPDAHWSVDVLLSEGDKVMIKQTVQGTHRNAFKGIPATGKSIKNQGYGIYTFRDGKIIRHEIQTDQLGFLQQLNVISFDPSRVDQDKNVFFVDRFTFPKDSFDDFLARMTMNREYIRTMDGFIRDEAMISEDPDGTIVVMTVAVWKDQACMEKAKESVFKKFKMDGFDPREFYQKFHIKADRRVFSPLISD